MMNNRREVSTLGHILEIKNLEVKYGVVPALKGISFYVDPGEIVALVGPNGAGKTTTLHAISGLVKGNKDSIFFKDKNINAIEPHKIVSLGISQVPEGRGIFPNLSVMENINLGHYLRRDKEGIKKDCEWVFDIFPRLKERQSQIAGTLSGGELQMLSIARALLASCLRCAALQRAGHDTRQTLRQLCRRAGYTVRSDSADLCTFRTSGRDKRHLRHGGGRTDRPALLHPSRQTHRPVRP